MTTAAIDSGLFRQVLGNYPTGVAVITSVGTDGEPLALVVGTFTSVSLDPPLVGFLPTRQSYTWQLIEATGRFAANIFGADQLAECGKLAGRDDKFTGVEWSLSPRGLHAVQDAGDHVFVTGTVEAMAVQRESDPMLFWRGRYGGFAG